jgi:hypothetical protein
MHSRRVAGYALGGEISNFALGSELRISNVGALVKDRKMGQVFKNESQQSITASHDKETHKICTTKKFGGRFM